MENLTNDQIQLILTLFYLQNADRDITDFVPDFYRTTIDFSNCKKIGDLELCYLKLCAMENRFNKIKWNIFRNDHTYDTGFCIAPVSGSITKWVSFDIMKHISFEDKI